MKMLFNDDPYDDVLSVLAFIEGFASEYSSEDILIDSQKVESIIDGIRMDFPHKDGLNEASVFKKIASFICFFVAEKPIHKPFKNSTLPSDILKISNYENSIIALLIGFTALHGANIRHRNGEEKVLSNPVELSEHSFIDMVDAISTVMPRDHFKLMTVFLEQLIYKTNSNCQYQVKSFTSPSKPE